MLSAEGCRQRRQRLTLPPEEEALWLAWPAHLMYLANFFVDPFSLGAGFGGLLRWGKDGHTTLFHDNHLPGSAEQAHVDERVVVPWYDGQSPERWPRSLALVEATRARGYGLTRVHDRPEDLLGPAVTGALASLRRRKDPDEILLLKRCMRAAEAGHAWARSAIRPGMTELDVYVGVCAACIKEAGQAVIVYGDFAVSPGPERIGGSPTSRVLHAEDLFILDFSVVIGGYRSDFTNTLAIGKEPRADQRRLYDLCREAMAAGEKELRAGAACDAVYQTVNGVFQKVGMAEYFPHHAGHGLGLAHPEPPFLVRHATDTLQAGDVVTLEPGLYVPEVGGLRIENNYLITQGGYERLSNHTIALT